MENFLGEPRWGLLAGFAAIIEPGANREFTFTAKNPSEGGEIAWKAHQRYADGTSSEWIGAAGTRQPAPVTTLTAASDGAQ